MLWPNATFNMVIAPTASLIINNKYKNILFDNKLKWFIDAEWYSRLFFKSKEDKNKIIFFPLSRIISYQSKNSITQLLKGKLKKITLKEDENKAKIRINLLCFCNKYSRPVIWQGFF